jgi:hypothetical protein
MNHCSQPPSMGHRLRIVECWQKIEEVPRAQERDKSENRWHGSEGVTRAQGSHTCARTRAHRSGACATSACIVPLWPLPPWLCNRYSQPLSYFCVVAVEIERFSPTRQFLTNAPLPHQRDTSFPCATSTPRAKSSHRATSSTRAQPTTNCGSSARAEWSTSFSAVAKLRNGAPPSQTLQRYGMEHLPLSRCKGTEWCTSLSAVVNVRTRLGSRPCAS